VGGVLERCWVILEWECGNILGGDEISFVTLFFLRLRLGLGYM
jgi:hypothetical protein